MPRLQYGNTNYSVTDDGRVFNDITGKELTPILRKGYLYVDIKIDGKFKHMNIHKMVAELYVPNPDNLPQVNHKDTYKLNNHDWNLEWVTSGDNTRHASQHGLLDNTNGAIAGSIKSSKQVVQYDRDTMIEIARFKSAIEAHRITSVRYKSITDCCNGLRSFGGGYVWEWGD